MGKQIGYWLLLSALLVGICSDVADSRGVISPSGGIGSLEVVPLGERALLNIGDVSMWFKRDGWSARNPLSDQSGVTFPRSTGQVIFQDGLIWGGRVLDGKPQELRVGGQTYRIGTVPGRIITRGVAEDPNDPSVRIYRVRRDYKTADLRQDASELFGKDLGEVTSGDIEALRNQYDNDWREWPWEKGAPFYDRDGDGAYSPQFDATGIPILDDTTDEPGLSGGDQVAWFAINDLDQGITGSLYGSDPIGLEAQVTLWGYARADALGDAISKKYLVIYKGTADTPDNAVIEDMYFAQWSDPDLGDYGDDFAGSDVALGLGYAYNASSSDSRFRAFDLAPPATGYVFLNRSMASSTYFATGSPISDPHLGEYSGTLQWYNLLRGFQPQTDVDNPVPFTDPDGNATVFALDGTPTIRDYVIQGTPEAVTICAGDAECLERLSPIAEITSPGQTTGMDYAISFEEIGNELTWNVLRESTLLHESLPLDQSVALPEDGIELDLGSLSGMMSWDIPTGERWYTWEGSTFLGAEGFEGAITGDLVNHSWFPSTVTPDQMRTVELRFTSVIEEDGENQYKPVDMDHENVSYAYRYLRNANGDPPAMGELTTTANPWDFSDYIVNTEGPGTYVYQDRVPIAVAAFDMESDPPRRLEVAFLENNMTGGLVNGAYGPAWHNTVDNISGSGPREWLFIFDLAYTDPIQGQNSQILLDNGIISTGQEGEDQLPFMWIVFAARQAEDRFPQDGDSFRMVRYPYPPYQAGDSFTLHVFQLA